MNIQDISLQRMLYAYGTGMTGQNPFADDEEVEITADIDSATER